MGEVNPHPRRGLSNRLLQLAGVIVGLAGCQALHAEQPAGPLPEYQVKAAFLLNFTKFVQWRADSFERADSPLAICILGDDPFGGYLDQVIEGEVVNGRKVILQRIRQSPNAKSCQVLFVSRSEKDVRGALAGAGTGVLTVGDQDGFLRDGGMISFVIEGRHVRFDVNQRAAARGSLVLSARLLRVARTVLK